MRIPDKTKIQSIDLRIRDMNASLNFYSHLLGLKEIEKADNISYLSATGELPYLIKLTEDKNSEINYKGAPGLYHLALRFSSRKELARVFLRLFNNNIKFQGFSDHLVSEAVYLADPDGNGVELYVDNPKESWIWKSGEVQMDSLPLDISVLTNELDDRETWNGIHPSTDLGHVHLNVTDILKAEKFYSNILGMNVTNFSYPGAKFFSAGGYHHHIGSNTWSAEKRIPKKDNSTGMESYTISIPDKEFIRSLENNAKEAGLLMEPDNSEITIRDYEGNKIKIVL